MAKVAIVILNWNGQKMLAKYLPNVVEYSRQEAEVWVADNSSSDQSMHLLETQFPQVKTIVLEQNYGFAEGYNRALKQIDAEYYVLLNSDVEVSHHWLTPLIEFMDSHEQVAACQPKLLAEYDKDMFEYAGACGGFLDKYGYPFCRGRIFDTVERDNGQYDYQQEILWATGACMMIRSKDYWKAGGLDGRFFAHNEEIDLCWRLRLMGRKIYCIPESEVYHVGGGTLPKSNPMKTYLNFRNNLTMLYKNLSDKDLKRVMRRRWFLDYLAAFETLVLNRNWGDCKAIFKARKAFKAWKHDFDEDRKAIQASRVEDRIPQVFSYSILWQYYAKGKKFFSQLVMIFALLFISLGAQAFNITVSNPSKTPRTDAPVVINLSKLGHVGSIQRAVVTTSDGQEIPSQLDDIDRDCVNDELCFLVDLGKKETKTYHVELYKEGEQAIYPARTFAELVLPSRNKKLAKNQQDIYLRSISFDKRTKDPYHYVHSHGICFESDLVAMRVYFDHRQTIDLYGKINKGLVIEENQFYPSEEQLAAGSGDDCLWVGNTYGLGALRGWDGKTPMLLNDVRYQEQRVISEGPLRAIIEVEDKGWVPAPGLQPVNATIRYTIYAGHRDFDVDVFLEKCGGFGESKDASDYQFATGLINVKGSSEYADGKGLRGCYGSDWPTGKDDGKHKLETVGLGIYVPQSVLVSQEPANKDVYTQVVKPIGNKLSYKLAYTSANETYGFKGEKEWYQWLKDWKKQIEEPLEVSVSETNR